MSNCVAHVKNFYQFRSELLTDMDHLVGWCYPIRDERSQNKPTPIPFRRVRFRMRLRKKKNFKENRS